MPLGAMNTDTFHVWRGTCTLMFGLFTDGGTDQEGGVSRGREALLNIIEVHAKLSSYPIPLHATTKPRTVKPARNR
jgi:hypothetical protein